MKIDRGIEISRLTVMFSGVGSFLVNGTSLERLEGFNLKIGQKCYL